MKYYFIMNHEIYIILEKILSIIDRDINVKVN